MVCRPVDTHENALSVEWTEHTYCRFETWPISFTQLCLCGSEETLKAVGSLHLVSVPGEVQYLTGKLQSYGGEAVVSICQNLRGRSISCCQNLALVMEKA